MNNTMLSEVLLYKRNINQQQETKSYPENDKEADDHEEHQQEGYRTLVATATKKGSKETPKKRRRRKSWKEPFSSTS